MLHFAAIRQEEWQAAGIPHDVTWTFFRTQAAGPPGLLPLARQPGHAERLLEVTRLSEENALLSRDFRCHEGGEFTNLAPNPEHSPVVYFRPGYESLDNWTFRGRFAGIRRGHVSEGLMRFPVSVWDPIRQPPLATQCHYLAIVETKPDPIRIWKVTRSDILWFAGDGKLTPPSSRTRPLPEPHYPFGEGASIMAKRLFAIGDIHGCPRPQER